MRKKYSFRVVLLLGLVFNLALFLTSCKKEALQNPVGNKVATGSPMHGQTATANEESITSSATITTTNKPTIPSPDIGYHLVQNGLYSIHPVGNSPLALDAGDDNFRYWHTFSDTWSLLNRGAWGWWLVSGQQSGFISQGQYGQPERSSYWHDFNPYQRWYITNLGNGYYSIRYGGCEGPYLGVLPNDSRAGSATFQFSAALTASTQLWRIGTSLSTGFSRIHNMQSGLALETITIGNFRGVQQNTPHNGASQTWRLHKYRYDCGRISW